MYTNSIDMQLLICCLNNKYIYRYKKTPKTQVPLYMHKKIVLCFV